MWELAHSVKLLGGQGGKHGLPRSVVEQVQRERLLEAMVGVAGELGYEHTSVERLIDYAGVSRRTFYDLFADREECFLAAYDEVIAHVLPRVVDACGEGFSPTHRLRNALETFLCFCAEEPHAARLCVVEVLAAGPRARARRASTMERLADLVEEPLRDLHGDRGLGSLAARAFIGGVHELIYEPVDRGEVSELPALADRMLRSQVPSLAPV
jgi:AcrR family transcriptional regulator